MPDSSKAVFLSYASQDAEAARRICDALRAAGVEVWFDQSELRGGDSWDQKIRKQIKECALFVPVISANTQARTEGYFRLEWRLADHRTHLMGKSKPFLVPVCIDDTRDSHADVPDSFVAVQWIRLPGGEPSEAFCARVKALLTDQVAARTSSSATFTDRPRTTAAASESSRGRQIALAVAGVTTVVALALWQPWKKPEVLTAAPAKIAPASPVSEARKLASQAKALIDDDPLAVRENYLATERLCQRAVTLDPADSEAWAVFARAGVALYARYKDQSTDRGQQTRSRAETALRLAPRSLEAELAMAAFDHDMGAGPEAARTRLEALAKRAPADRRILELLAWSELRAGRREQGEAWAAQAAALPGGSALALAERARFHWVRSEMAQMGELVDRSLATRATSFGYYLKLVQLVWGMADFEAARALLAAMPASLRQEDRIAAIAYHLELWSRRFEAASDILGRVPREFLEEEHMFYPKGFLIGEALQHTGKSRGAEIQRRSALKAVEARLAGEPNSAPLLVWKGKLLARLGDRAEALRCFEAAEELGIQGERWTLLLPAKKWVLLGRHDDAIEACAARLVRTSNRWPLVVNDLRFDPIFDPLRGLPRFQELVTTGERWFAELEPAGGVNRQAKSPEPATSTPAAAGAKSVAVLAFANLSDDKENEYFSDGISEELLNVLAKVPGLRVAARTSAFYFKGKQVPMADIAKQLGVAYLVEGSVRKSGARLRIAAQLVNAADGFQVWSDTFDRELKDVFALQDEIAGLIAQRLQLELGPVVRRTKPIDPRAHELVLQGRHFWNQRSHEGFAKAEAAFNEAIAVAPEYAAAYAGLAEVNAIRSAYTAISGSGDPEPTMLEAERAARAALQLEPRSSEAYAVLGNVFWQKGKHQEAEAAYRRAFDYNPSNATARLWYNLQISARGQLDASIRELESAVALDPLSFSAMGRLAHALYWAGRYEEALRVNERAIALEGRRFISSRASRAQILLALGRRNEAVEMATLVRQSDAGEFRLNIDATAIWVLKQAGYGGEAEKYATEVLRRTVGNKVVRGSVLAALGRFEEALPELENRYGHAITSYFWDPMWDPFRSDPRFHQLLVRLDCESEYAVARATLARMRNEYSNKN